MSRKSFLVTASFLATTFLASAANAAEPVKLTDGAAATALVGAGLAIGIAAVGGALGQGRAAAAALEGIARNPSASDKLFTPMILGLALIESLVIYALVIAFMIVNKVA